MYRPKRCANCFGHSLLLTFLLLGFGSELNAQTSDSPTQVQSIGDDVLSDADIRLEARIRQAIFRDNNTKTESRASIYAGFQGKEIDRIIEFIFSKNPKLPVDTKLYDHLFNNSNDIQRQERCLQAFSRLCRGESFYSPLICEPGQFSGIGSIGKQMIKRGARPPVGLDLDLVSAIRKNHNYGSRYGWELIELLQSRGFAANEEMRSQRRFSFEPGQQFIDSFRDGDTPGQRSELHRFLFYNVPPEKIEPAFRDVLQRIQRLEKKSHYHFAFYRSILDGLAREVPTERVSEFFFELVDNFDSPPKSNFGTFAPIIATLGRRLGPDDLSKLVLVWSNETYNYRRGEIASLISSLFANSSPEVQNTASKLFRLHLIQKIASRDFDSLRRHSKVLIGAADFDEKTSLASIVYETWKAAKPDELSVSQSTAAMSFCLRRSSDLPRDLQAALIENALDFVETNQTYYSLSMLSMLHSAGNLLSESQVRRAIEATENKAPITGHPGIVESLRKRFTSLLNKKRKEPK